MKVLSFGLIWNVLQVILIFVSGTISAIIQIYKDQNYSEIVLELSLTDVCNYIPRHKWQRHRSVITDTCVIIYNDPNCRSTRSRKVMPGKTSYFTEQYSIESIRKCNDLEGGPELNVDITAYFESRFRIPNVLESYYDVCRCINIPLYVQYMEKYSIDNHHNALFVYFERDCTEQHLQALFLDAGHWPNSRDMYKHSRIYKGSTRKIQSIGPASNTTYFQKSCLPYSNDKVMKLELMEALNSSGPHIITNLNPLSTFLISGANDDPIHFFADHDFQGFHFGSRSTTSCHKFPEPVKSRMANGVGSVQTKTCVILYSLEECSGRSIKIEAPGSNNLTKLWEATVTGVRTIALLYTKYPNWKWVTKSYHVCNKDKGGSSLNVEIYSDDQRVWKIDGPVILESYKKLCSCRNVPEYVQQLDRWSINNNANAIMAYFSADCLSTTHLPLWIPAGQSSYSLGLGAFKSADKITGVIYKIQSFGPDPNSDYFIKNCNKNCIQLSLLGNEQTDLNVTKVCDFDTKSESTQVALLVFERMQVHEANLEKRNKELVSLLEKTALNLENAKQDFKDKLDQQSVQIQQLSNRLNSHIHY